jgi:2-oxoglutarate ferredoxin oxidoreductase subunit beta
MTDLDIGMNQRLCEPFAWDDARRYDRGKVMTAEELEAGRDFGRYKDVDGDGIPWRTLPGTHPTKGSYFTRGTTRDPYARYSERGPDYIYNMERLLKKFATAATLVPQPVLRRRRRQDAAGRHLLRLHQPGHARGAGRAGQGRACTWTRCACAPSRSPTAVPSSSTRTSRCSWWSRTATPDAQPAGQRAGHRPGAAGARAALRRHADHRPLHHPGHHSPHVQAQETTRMTYIAKPGCTTPRCRRTRSATPGATTRARSPRCAPAAGTTASRAAIIQACWELDIEPHRVAKLSGIGCSSKTPDYFLGASHGFNTVHGRMPSVLTGANLANRDLLYLGVSGDGDSASIGLGQFAHAMRRGVRMAYIVENNGVYGLTKGQFSATADQGSKSKKGVVNADSPVDLVAMALQLGATYVARGFSGDKAQLVPLIKGAMATAARPSSTSSAPAWPSTTTRQHQELRLRARAQRGGQPHRLHHAATRSPLDHTPPARWSTCASTTARCCACASLHAGYDPTDRWPRWPSCRQHQARGEVVTGLLYVDPLATDLHTALNTSAPPLNALGPRGCAPARRRWPKINASLALTSGPAWRLKRYLIQRSPPWPNAPSSSPFPHKARDQPGPARPRVHEAACVMTRANCGSVLVMDHRRIVLLGIVTERDLMTRVLAKALDPDATAPRRHHDANPICVPPETKVSDAVVIMIERGFRHLPIVAPNGRVMPRWACSRCATRCRARSARRMSATGRAPCRSHEQVNDCAGHVTTCTRPPPPWWSGPTTSLTIRWNCCGSRPRSPMRMACRSTASAATSRLARCWGSRTATAGRSGCRRTAPSNTASAPPTRATA